MQARNLRILSVFIAAALLVLSAFDTPSFAEEAQCDLSAFREAVAAASASLTSLHERNSRIFQERLQRLRIAHGWQETDFAGNALPFVKDEITASLDAANQRLLAGVQALESGQATTEAGRCFRSCGLS
jgi:hypothetical protein